MTSLAGNLYFYHTDNFGTPMAMTDINGEVVWRADELPFGEEHETIENPIPNNRRFLGKELDRESGLICMGARFLDPKTGRFTQPDPVGLVDPATGKVNQEMLVNPQRQNRYVYALNNPYKFIDPGGTDPYENNTLRCHVNPHWDSTENMIGGAIVAAGMTGAFIPEAIGVISKAAQFFPAITKIGETSTRNWKHISKHLSSFQELDSKMTLKSVERLGRKIASNGKNFVSAKGGNTNFEQVVKIGGNKVNVRAVLNKNNTLRSIHIRTKR
jgi:RHS repeat-associated protein